MNRRLTAALVFLVTVVAMEAMSVAVVLPNVEEELRGMAWYGWVFAAFWLAQILAIPLTGQWADRWNPAGPLVGGIVSFSAGLLVAGWAESMPMLVAGRALQGLGAGIIPAVAYVCVGRGFAEEVRPRVFALMSMAWIVPSVVGPAAASFVIANVGWRWVFWGLIPVTVVAGGLAVPSVAALGPPTQHHGAVAGRLGATLVAVVGATALIAGFQQRRPMLVLILVGAGLAVTAIALSRLTPAGTLRFRAGLPATIASRGVLTCVFFAADALVPLTMERVRGTGPQYSGVVLASSALLWSVGSWTQARTIDRVGPRSLLRAGLLVVGAGIALLIVVAVAPVPTWVAVVAWALGGAGIGLAYSPLSVVTLARAEPGREGFATSALQLSDAFGVAIGTGIGGAVVSMATRWNLGVDDGVVVVYVGSLILAVAGAALATRVPSSVSGSVDTAAVS